MAILLLEHEGGEVEVDEEGENIGGGEADGAGGNLRVQLEAVENGGDREDDEAGHNNGDGNAAADDHRGQRMAAPDPGDNADDDAARTAQHQRGEKFLAQRA